MTADDLAQVHALECAAQQSPWRVQHFAAELDNPCARIDLCWRDCVLAGFLCAWLIAGELQIQNVATAPACRRQGVAARLLARVLECSRAAGPGRKICSQRLRTWQQKTSQEPASFNRYAVFHDRPGIRRCKGERCRSGAIAAER